MYLPGLMKLAKDVCGQEVRLAEEEWQALVYELEKTISNLPIPIPQISLEEFMKKNGSYYPAGIKIWF